MRDLFTKCGYNCGRCQFFPPEEGGWLTPTGALKSGPWLVRMSFDKRIGGADTLVALKEYSSSLEEKYGGEVFKHFAQADMRWLKTSSNRIRREYGTKNRTGPPGIS